ncbi:MAG: hypothetical protein JWO38_2259 [Gemmataceae bacterium]|nr:hypothetical protein [Gemmataceae bacterium]
MDRLAEHEAFLRAIFAAPDEDTPRLVFADFLEENGAPERAEFIRVQCELERVKAAGTDPDRLELLVARSAGLAERLGFPPELPFRRGFARSNPVLIAARELADPDAFRRRVVTDHPEWYGATALTIEPVRALFPDEIPVLFDLPFTQQVAEWDFGGHPEELTAGPLTEDAGTFGLIDVRERPVINPAGVAVLAQCRGARRIRTLVLTNNRLDSDTVRSLIASRYLINLTRLALYDGNRFSARVWQQLIERFGENVVG